MTKRVQKTRTAIQKVSEPTVWWKFVGRDHDDVLPSLAGAKHLTDQGGSVGQAMQPGSLPFAWLHHTGSPHFFPLHCYNLVRPHNLEARVDVGSSTSLEK